MTRRGSLVYYLASWICGGFFMTVAMFFQEQFAPQGMGMGPSGAGAIILTTYFLILIYRAFFSVVFAFLLRLSMNWLHAEKLWVWTLAGFLISLPMGLSVRWASVATDASGLQGAGREVATLLFLGLRGIVERHILITFPVAALNSMVLFLIHRAFTKEHPPLENAQK